MVRNAQIVDTHALTLINNLAKVTESDLYKMYSKIKVLNQKKRIEKLC